ncbi:hypothetical protein FRB98_002939 [Tulasnella sp. 332]|nr:hypothetical protein FRB98_002939 [Tulasnella sp. 332]
MSLQRFAAAQPVSVFNAAILPLAFFALPSTPSLMALIFLITGLLLYTTVIIRRQHVASHLLLLLLNLSVASTMANLGASTTALPSAILSLGSGLFRSLASSLIPLIVFTLNATMQRQNIRSPWLRIILFPTIWTIAWMTVSRNSPVGRLGLWTPLLGDGAYTWTRPYVGLAGVDFVTGAWAILAAELAGSWIQGSTEETVHGEASGSYLSNGNGDGHRHADFLEGEEPIISYDEEHAAHPHTTATPSLPSPHPTLFVLLVALTLPSFFISPIPLPPHSPHTTPVGVSCILPMHRSTESTSSVFDQYLTETKQFASRARIHLWPEGAIHFDGVPARKIAMDKVRETAETLEVWIGASFDEPDPFAGKGPNGREGVRRNGMALMGPKGEVFEYFKRILVPIAESYSHQPSPLLPPLATISIPMPHVPRKKKKNPEHRPVTLTTSICLDFSQPLPILPGHPSLILAPARTWHPTIGHAMAQLAQARADEIGAAILWCDGGSGGVSGVYGAGRGDGLEVAQTGNGGTWITTIGVPFNEGSGEEETAKTMYGRMGDIGSFVVLMGLVGLGLAYEMGMMWWSGRRSVSGASGQADSNATWSKWMARSTGRLGGGVRLAIGYVTRRGAVAREEQTRPAVPAPEQANLINMED